LTIPYVIIDGFFYIKSSLHRKERMILIYSVPILLQIYLITCLLGYKLLDGVLKLFQLTSDTTYYTPLINYQGYISFVAYYFLVINLYALSPFILLYFTASGVLKYELIRKFWRSTILFSFILACALVPSNDPIILISIALPIIIIYLVILLAAYLKDKSDARRQN
jgi:sec-independent protein translocase protein TatC